MAAAQGAPFVSVLGKRMVPFEAGQPNKVFAGYNPALGAIPQANALWAEETPVSFEQLVREGQNGTENMVVSRFTERLPDAGLDFSSGALVADIMRYDTYAEPTVGVDAEEHTPVSVVCKRSIDVQQGARGATTIMVDPHAGQLVFVRRLGRQQRSAEPMQLLDIVTLNRVLALSSGQWTAEELAENVAPFGVVVSSQPGDDEYDSLYVGVSTSRFAPMLNASGARNVGASVWVIAERVSGATLDTWNLGTDNIMFRGYGAIEDYVWQLRVYSNGTSERGTAVAHLKGTVPRSVRKTRWDGTSGREVCGPFWFIGTVKHESTSFPNMDVQRRAHYDIDALNELPVHEVELAIDCVARK